MPTLLSEEDMDAKDSVDESYDEPMSTEMLEDIFEGSQSHPNVNKIEARYKKNLIVLSTDNCKTWVKVYTR